MPIVCAVAVPTWAWPNTIGETIHKSEPTNSISHTMKVTPMFTSVSLRRRIFDLSDSNFSRFWDELRSLKFYMLYYWQQLWYTIINAMKYGVTFKILTLLTF